jgi:hypothetical protein
MLLLAGCAAAGAGSSFRLDAPQASSTIAGITLTSSDFQHGGTSLLQVLARRVLSMQVSRGSGGCPSVKLRGGRSIADDRAPGIYVDNIPVRSTCVLELIDPGEVERVEVYPSGYSEQIRYTSHPYGLIVVYTRRHHASSL